MSGSELANGKRKSACVGKLICCGMNNCFKCVCASAYGTKIAMERALVHSVLPIKRTWFMLNVIYGLYNCSLPPCHPCHCSLDKSQKWLRCFFGHVNGFVWVCVLMCCMCVCLWQNENFCLVMSHQYRSGQSFLALDKKLCKKGTAVLTELDFYYVL